MSIIRPIQAFELSGAHIGATVEILGDAEPGPFARTPILGRFVIAGIQHYQNMVFLTPASDPDNVAELPYDSDVRVVAGGPEPAISVADQEFLTDYCNRVLDASNGPRHEYLPIPAEDAARIWQIRANLDRRIDGAFHLFVLLDHMSGHNCGVCGKPDDDACILGC